MSEEDKYFPSRFLRASDIEEPTNATITEGSDEMIGQPGQYELKAKVKFEEFDKELVLNKTNFMKIRGVVAQEQGLDEEKVTMSDWPGTVINLYTTKVNFKGKEVDAIRIQPMQKKSSQSKIDKAMEKEAAEDSMAEAG